MYKMISLYTVKNPRFSIIIRIKKFVMTTFGAPHIFLKQ